MLLECLLQLCSTRRSREFLRAKGVYEILREYHKWEAKVGRDSDCLLACENVVDILIKSVLKLVPPKSNFNKLLFPVGKKRRLDWTTTKPKWKCPPIRPKSLSKKTPPM